MPFGTAISGIPYKSLAHVEIHLALSINIFKTSVVDKTLMTFKDILQETISLTICVILLQTCSLDFYGMLCAEFSSRFQWNWNELGAPMPHLDVPNHKISSDSAQRGRAEAY